MPDLRRTALAAAVVLAAATAAGAEGPCRRITHEGRGYAVCEADAGADLRLFLTAPDGRPWGGFARLEAALAGEGLALGFAMNAGMYHEDRRPVGLYIEAGTELAALVTGPGPGNFGMQPNGVFCVLSDGRFAVVETGAYAADPPDCRFATQSGPMLVIDAALHPRFLVGSTSRFVRNGVGVSADGGRAIFAISDRPVTFHEFARLFRDMLGTPQALYLDGSVSRLHAPGLGRSDFGRPLGPIVALVLPADRG